MTDWSEWNCAFPRLSVRILCDSSKSSRSQTCALPVLFWKSHAPCKDDKELFQRKRIQTVCRSGPRSRIWSLQDGRVTTWLATVFWTYKTGFPVRCAKGQTARQTYNSYAICQFCLVCTIVWRCIATAAVLPQDYLRLCNFASSSILKQPRCWDCEDCEELCWTLQVQFRSDSASNALGGGSKPICSKHLFFQHFSTAKLNPIQRCSNTYSKRRVPQQDCADVQADDDDCTPGAQGWCTPVEILGTQPWNRFSKIEGILKSFEIKDFSILNVFFCFPRFDFKEFILMNIMNPCLREIHCFQVAFDGVDPSVLILLGQDVWLHNLGATMELHLMSRSCHKYSQMVFASEKQIIGKYWYVQYTILYNCTLLWLITCYSMLYSNM